MSLRKAPTATRKDPAVLIRFPRDVLKKVEAASAASGRSRNTEILYRLQLGLQSDATHSAAAAA